MTDFQLGVNYWPRASAMDWWKEFDAGIVDEDMARIAAYGMRYVRFFLLWEDFQPEPDRVSGEQLQNLITVLDIAGKHRLRAYPTLLAGNMSGVMWWPSWLYTDEPEQSGLRQITNGHLVDRRIKDLYGNPSVLRAETLLAREASAAIAGHPALAGWDLANEIDQETQPRDPDEGWLWAWTVSHGVEAPTITYGAHPLSLTTRGLTIPAIAPSLDYLSMHGYPQYSDVARGPLDPELAPFVTALTAQLGQKDCLMQEFGVATTGPDEPGRWIEDWFLGSRKKTYLASEEEGAHYTAAVLDRLWQIGAMGGLLWVYADYAPSLYGKPPFERNVRERYFGLFRADGSPKPAAEVVKRFAEDLASHAMAGRLGAAGAGRVALPIDPTAYYKDPAVSYRAAYHDYLEIVAASGDASRPSDAH